MDDPIECAHFKHFLSVETTLFSACLFRCININIETLYRNRTLNHAILCHNLQIKKTLNVKQYTEQ